MTKEYQMESILGNQIPWSRIPFLLFGCKFTNKEEKCPMRVANKDKIAHQHVTNFRNKIGHKDYMGILLKNLGLKFRTKIVYIQLIWTDMEFSPSMKILILISLGR